MTSPVDVEGLRRDLFDAIANEDYERAARLRDRLRQANQPTDDDSRGVGS
jgi:protein-arginine kinase activator protein McsA